MRSGGWERSARDARSVPVFDTGASIAGPGGERAAGPRLAAGRRPLRPHRGARHPRRRRGRRATSPPASSGSSGSRRREGEEEEAPAPRRRSPAPARPSATAPTTSRSRASAPGGRRSRSSTARAAAPVPVPEADLPVVLPRDIAADRRGQPAGRAPRLRRRRLPAAAASRAKRETDTLDCHFDALLLWVPAAVPPEARAEQMFTHPDLRRVAAGRAPGRRRRQRRLRLRPADRHQGAARPSAPSSSSPTASRSPAASSTRW